MFSPYQPIIGILMLMVLLAAFAAMTRYNAPQALAMALVACVFLGLQGKEAEDILRIGFSHFAPVCILFSAVGIAAHQIERSGGFENVAGYLGRHIGVVAQRHPRLALPILVAELLAMTYVAALLLHNITAVLLMVPITIRVCRSYAIPSRWILCGELPASNLGGFSAPWSDTPNIVESRVWGLNAADFTREVMPPNLILLLVLIVVVTLLTRRAMNAEKPTSDNQDDKTARADRIATERARWMRGLKESVLDRRLLLIGMTTMTGFIVVQAVWPPLQIVAGALTILGAILLDRGENRLDALGALGFHVYVVFGAIFVLAGCVEHSWIGVSLQQTITDAGAAPWAISITGYLGTTFTEAASWATAASARIHPLDGTHAAAWALGAGICAGSSSLVTAASAGIILCGQSARFKDPKDVITFRRYLAFGMSFSLFMLVFYCVYFSLVRY